MTSLKRTLFISDLHLDEDTPEAGKQFIELISNTSDIDALYILGDFFEVWIGDDEMTPFHQTIIHALKRATQSGLQVFFMHGNRDFLIGKKFLKATGCQMLPDEAKINLYGTPVLLMHGDLLCTKDIEYLKARKFAKNPIVQRIFLLLPLVLRKKIAARMRAKSKVHTRITPRVIMDVTLSEVIRIMENHQVTTLIHGHTHLPFIHQVTLSNLRHGERIVLGAWHEHGNIFIWDEKGNKELKNLPAFKAQ